MSPVTLNEVARLAGVSPKTVSRVVNGEPNVRPETRDVVERAISTLGYRPNLAARSLAAARSYVIGLITSRLDNDYFRQIHVSGVRACRARNLHLMVEEVEGDDAASVRQLEASVRQLQLEGVLLPLPLAESPAVLDMLDRMGVRYVRLSPVSAPERSDSVTSDFVDGSRQIARHLAALGHTCIAVASAGRRTPHRLEQELLALGRERDAVTTVPLNWRISPNDAGRELAARMLSLQPRPTAVFAFNDEVAAGVVGYAWEHGIRVPDDLSVVGYDDGEPALSIWPPLTTVRQPLEAMVTEAVRLLVEPAGPGEVRNICLPVELVVRRSSGQAPSGQ